MITRISPFALPLLVALALGACQGAREPAPQVAASPPPEGPSAFVEAACGGCHGLEPPFLSPNPAAPSFASIANREGATKGKLAKWLVDAHNYPEQIDFDLKDERVGEVASYIFTLKRADYEPEP